MGILPFVQLILSGTITFPQTGRLGHGTEEDKPTPHRISIDEPVLIKDVFCGIDGTMFLTDAGGVLACGNNECNKLGLNNRQGFLMALKQIFNQSEVDGALKPTCVRSLNRHRVVDIMMGAKHSAVLVESGTIITLGEGEKGPPIVFGFLSWI